MFERMCRELGDEREKERGFVAAMVGSPHGDLVAAAAATSGNVLVC